jgi:hypothetical protein
MLLVALFLGVASAPRLGATVYHSNGSVANAQWINNNLASNGDTITFPAGTFTWTSTLTITKGITLQGAGIGQTIITNIQGTGAGVPADGQYLTMDITAPSGSRVTVTGFEFRGNRTASGIMMHGGDFGVQTQIDHCKFSEFRGRGVITHGLISGLVYANEFVDNRKMIDTYAWTLMNASWQTPLTLGTTKCVVIEDNTFTYTNGGWYPASAACTSSVGLGGRATFRHNTWKNNHQNLTFYPINDAHGNQQPVNRTTNWGEHRGTRQLELYGNTFTNNTDSAARLVHLRGGDIVMFDNIYTGPGRFDNKVYLQEEDGPSRFNYLTTYPGYDQNYVYVWNNKVIGQLITDFHTAAPSDLRFIIKGTNLFFSQRPNYVPLQYPHPWRTADSVSSFNGDGSPDFVLQNASTGQTAVWYMDNNTRINSAVGPTAGWPVAGVADFNLDGHPDYLLFSPSTGQTAIWYLNNNVRVSSALGPTTWAGWNVAGVADFNLDGHPDYLLFNPITGQTAIWYLNGNARVFSALGPTTWAGWNVAGVADFNLDGHPDYLLFNPITGQTAIWYLNDNARVSSAFGPTIWAGWNVVAP